MTTRTASIYGFHATTGEGDLIRFDEYRGRVLLVVNVASQCGFTPQYRGLEALYRKYRDAGLTVLAFPSDQFGHQEPGTDADIRKFCASEYDVTFPLFQKTDVNGPAAHPLYRYLKTERRGLLGSTAIKWNFTKFLVDRQGQVLGRYGSSHTPAALEGDIVEALAQPAWDPSPS